MQANVYIDGFNLYYGALHDTAYRWLDLAHLCQELLPRHTINHVRYFTARIRPRADDPQKATRQQTYLRALATLPTLSVHYGHFLDKRVRMPLAQPPTQGARTVEVIRTDEKGSDVNLATYLLVDGFRGDYEMAAVISNDSDLTLPIAMVRAELRRDVGVFNPQRISSRALQGVASFYRPVREPALRASQFPPVLQDQHGRITKPRGW
jgi:hypothetical protein